MIKTLCIEFNQSASKEDKEEVYNALLEEFDLNILLVREQNATQSTVRFVSDGWDDYLPYEVKTFDGVKDATLKP